MSYLHNMFRRTFPLLLPVCIHGCGWVVGDLPEPFVDSSQTDASGIDASPQDGSLLDVAKNDIQADQAFESSNEQDTDVSTETSACDPCDCDEDGALAKTCDGDDCDDMDARVHPGQEKYFDEPSATVGFDYDCSGTIERDPALNVGLGCSGLSLVGCEASKQGFTETVPPCGELGDWGTCKYNGLICISDVYEQRRMRCK